MSGIQTEYAGRSQQEIHQGVCRLTDDILLLRNARGYAENNRLQTLRQRRAELQQLLTKPHVVWSR